MAPPRKRKAPAKPFKANKSTKTSGFSRAGRPLKKPTLDSDNSFVDSGLALEDDSSEEEEVLSQNEESVHVLPSRRRLSRTPERARHSVIEYAIPPESEVDESISSSDEDAEPVKRGGNIGVVQPLQIVLQVPAGQAREITLNIDSKQLAKAMQTTARQSKLQQTDCTEAAPPPTPRTFSKNVIRNAGLIGKLPPEIREKIYLDIFQSTNVLRFELPDEHFQRSAAFLRTCRMVYEEGRIILYERNQFRFRHSAKTYGSLWANNWRKLDYDICRVFMKMIGNHNIALLRNVFLEVWDLPLAEHRDLSAEERLAVNNETLLSIMRDLVRYSELRTLTIRLATGRHISRADSRFVDIMTRIKADEVEIEDVAHTSAYYRLPEYVRNQPASVKAFVAYCTKKMTRKTKLYPQSVERYVNGVLKLDARTAKKG